jgi:epoxyqueuosine reductase
MLTTELIQKLETRGYRAGVVCIKHLPQLREEIEDRYRQGLLDGAFYEERLTGFALTPPESLSRARSLIVVGVRDPHVRFTFSWQGLRIPLTVPPSYLHWRETDRAMADVLREILEPACHRVVPAAVPKKLLAARSGMAVYGRNNVTYVPGMGSYYRLAAFASDLPCEQDAWQEHRMLERCEACRACLRGCPTGAISSERFLLHAERCLTFLNEKPPDEPFPAWVDSAWHNCLVGCLHCQRVCPENRDVPTWVEEGAAFSERETAFLLEAAPVEALPTRLVEKLEQWDLIGLLDELPRNLRVLLERSA